MGSWFKPTVEHAPCPPFFVDNVYEIFINQARVNNLTAEVTEEIRKKCSIDIPTTTTTSTTTTTTTTTPEPSTTDKHPTTRETVTESSTVTTLNVTVTDATNTSISQVQTTTLSYQNSSDINRTSANGPTSTVQTTEVYLNTTIESKNVTLPNVTESAVKESVSSAGCNTICIIGIGTGAVCLCLLCLLFIALATLFRKGRQSQTRSRSQSRSRFGDMPDVDLYDSVDIGDSPASKRNSGSSLFRRSGDFTRSPPVVFDNPAYRRSFELRPSRYNSWYDPDATDFNYSQNNANLIARKSRNSDRRSVSTSRLNDKNTHAQEHRRHGSSSSWHSSIRDHVPKMLNSSSEGDFEQRSPYLYSSQNRLISNGVNDSPGLPRTPIENVGNQKRPNAKSKHSYRSRSYDPDLSTGSGSLEETQFMSINNERSRGQYMKHNQSKKNVARERKDKMSKRKDRRPTDIDIPHDRIYRNNSENRNKYSPIQYPRNSSYRGTESHILSSNLHPVSTNYNGVGDNYGRNRSRTNSDRSPDVDDYYAGQGRSFRDISSDNNRRYNNRHSSYKPDRNEIYMFQTKL